MRTSFIVAGVATVLLLSPSAAAPAGAEPPSPGHDAVSPSRGNDAVSPSRGHDAVSPSRGHDAVSPSPGHDAVSPSRGNDAASSSRGNDAVSPSRGHDAVSPSRGHDAASPSRGHDAVSPSRGNDAASSSRGNDVVSSSRGPHVRPLTKAATTFLTDATQRSPVVRGLVERLDETDVVVYLADAIEGCSPNLRACLTFLASAAGTRYLLVRTDRWLVAPWDRIGWLAHELQHAMEIAAAPSVQDPASLGRFYGRVGWQSGPGRFETSQARVTGDRARQQLAGQNHR